jgi:hypothetical protein
MDSTYLYDKKPYIEKLNLESGWENYTFRKSAQLSFAKTGLDHFLYLFKNKPIYYLNSFSPVFVVLQASR